MLSRSDSNDFTSYLLSSKALLSGINPYLTGSPFPYVYPLTFAFFLIPFTVIPEIITQIIWFIFNVWMLYKSAIYLMTINKSFTLEYKYTALVLAAIILLNFIQNNLVNAQVNIFIIFLCLQFFIFYKKRIYNLSAIFLAMAISIKILPVFILIFLLFRNKYRHALRTIIFSLLLLIIPAIVIGDKIIAYYIYYFKNIINVHYARVTSFATGMFFNLPSLIGLIYPGSFNGIIIYLLNFIFVVFLFLILFYFYKKLDDWSLFPILFIGFLFISPISETHHLIFLFPCIMIIIISFFSKNSFSDYFDWVLIFCIITSIALSNYIHFFYLIFIITTLVLYVRIILRKSIPIADGEFIDAVI
jgi:hypothetical protein